MDLEKKVVSLEDRIPKLQQQRKQKTNRRLISFLSIFFLLILLVIYFQSPLSKVGSITVEGNVHVDAKEIINLSEITTSSGFWNINTTDVQKSIEEHLQIKKAVIEKKFPNHVVLVVDEYKSMAYLEDQDGFRPILENGQVLKERTVNVPADAPVLINWKKEENIKEMMGELKKLSPSIFNSISEIHHTPDKTDPWLVHLYMNDGYEVIASVRTFSEKMNTYSKIVSQLEEDSKGIIHFEVGTYFESYTPLTTAEEDEAANEDER
ncbi:cell division protein FtsQ [Bacillus sp. UMB0899]|uniref:cell division protein FtsQ/DivIB n=1 Tax=Metabacillus schmidteae TaxID=2730405 RepID=UPI000C80D6E7|nr:FtsQ-type POTRA domain-containing protein [Metabacillus schmidteae]PMC38347.1 cell division protein FtsQ [Bacillus sp. UMB0899]